MSTYRLTRRGFLAGAAVALAGAGAGLGYGLVAEPRWLQVTRHRATLRRSVTSPVTLLHLSDLHLSSFVGLAFIEKAIRLGLRQSPDFACVTGDFVTAGNTRDLDDYPDVLRLLSSQVPTYAVLGNHDGGAWSKARGGDATFTRVSNVLKAADIQLLDNRSVVFQSPGGPVTLVGVGDLWGGNCEPVSAFERVSTSSSTPTVLLAHNPDTKDQVGNRAWDLMLSGHTHGGQVVIPFLGAPFAPVRDRRFVAGLRPWRDRMIYTTRGVGSLYGVRLNCRPEVSLVELA